ncbi:Csu type fimbrial protein [Montanilutibacter psychrotolerans]|uniref:SCPU domain-containing protein n=1 Tax=Montanilutibacter psychrotolerans TaxID=1327343 RepID=A0A3M8SUA8_9GAMM|nr:spore coat U domain-containing protein [Lysobacter psychrotolerans]RNF84911.1 SCPU domain-containing protein [Lysobacter psychrotolerans]
MNPLPRAIGRLLGALLLAALWWCLPAPAQAATSCNTTPTPLSFGTVTGAANVDNTATVGITCSTSGLTLLATVRVRMCLNIDAGVNGAGQTNPRRLTNTFGDPMQFQIYRDAARTQIWGSTSTPATPTPVQIDLQYNAPVLGGSGNTSATLFGRVAAQLGLSAGLHNNPFTGAHTRLDYRYAEQLLGTPPYPASCTSGGTGGGSITFPFTASATVPNHCIIDSATDLDFGNVPGPIAADIDQTSTVTMTCTNRTPWNMALDDGQNASGVLRRMRLGATGNYLGYELYRDAGRTLRWGAAIGTDTVPGTGSGSSQSLTVHGRVPAVQSVPPGDYADVITVTVTY